MMRHWYRAIEEVWFGKHAARVVLMPLAWLYRAAVWLRRHAYTSRLLHVYRAPVPVIIVGNVTVGGNGKTPLTVWLARRLADYGFKPGIIARGYRGRARKWPQQVRADSDPVAVGDEAVVLARRTGLPVAVGPSRSASIDALLRHAGTNIIVSDDGLQHYAIARDIEIAVVDGVRRMGNGLCLPAGPLREPATRLHEVDLVVANGLAARGEFSMRCLPQAVQRVTTPDDACPLDEFPNKNVHAVAAIAAPERFFGLLRRHGFRYSEHVFQDHYRFTHADFAFGDSKPIIMTEKDAVKCEHFADERFWFLPIEAELPEVFERRLKTLLKKVLNG